MHPSDPLRVLPPPAPPGIPAPAPGGKTRGRVAPAAVGGCPAGAPPPDSPATRVEQELVTGAYRKLMDRKPLTREERAALARHEKAKEEKLRWQYYRSIPQKHWRAMSGRQTKVLNEQATRYGLPLGGATIDLPALARAVHDFLADNARKLAREDDPLLKGGGASPALERYREERTALARLDRLQRERELVPRQEVRVALGQIAAILRGAGEALGRQFGAAAAEVLHEALDDARKEIDRSFAAVRQMGEVHDDHDDVPAPVPAPQSDPPELPDPFERPDLIESPDRR